ncbi:hypothetical protein KL86CLO1_10481 [uncultured Eubacteriales bacterium]|uniref:Uncharacterized protein n=1 Tax=uncultured Eubacteriales bacterium TaxID=172733 RepID=A0A212J419_9FIRM|nr:hypothetical protein KL86CLO1_10481 [uncultured Eubacteriales bacterium]
MRPIDADALLKNYGLKDAAKYGGKDRHGYDTLMLYEIRDMIEDAPTIDPVKHGRWVRPYASGTKIKNPYCFCSNCAQWASPRKMSAYCPSCGAKMDGDGGVPKTV